MCWSWPADRIITSLRPRVALRQDARIDMVITRMLDQEAASAEPATDDDVRQYPAMHSRPDGHVRLAHVISQSRYVGE